MGTLGFEPRSKACFREGIVIAEAQPSNAGGPNSSRYTTSPQARKIELVLLRFLKKPPPLNILLQNTNINKSKFSLKSNGLFFNILSK